MAKLKNAGLFFFVVPLKCASDGYVISNGLGFMAWNRNQDTGVNSKYIVYDYALEMQLDVCISLSTY